MEENAENQIKVATEHTECPTCGSDMVFDPDKNLLVCLHCNHTETIDAHVERCERDFVLDELSTETWEGTHNFRCESCGAVTSLDVNEISTRCPFCGAPKVVEVADQPGIKPMGIIPFAFGKDKVKEKYVKWAKKLVFAPSKFKKSVDADKMNGVYIPCWAFDSNTVSKYYGRVGEHYTVTVGSGKDRHTETRTRWRNISGVYTRFFDDVTVQASKQISEKFYQKIEPYDTNSPMSYNGKYMRGFSAERYNKGAKECFGVAAERMRRRIENDILSREHADEVDYLKVSVQHNDVKYKYILLPVWSCSCEYKEKRYGFFVNGQTGKTAGKFPVSPIRVTFAVVLGIALAVLAVWLFSRN